MLKGVFGQAFGEDISKLVGSFDFDDGDAVGRLGDVLTEPGPAKLHGGHVVCARAAVAPHQPPEVTGVTAMNTNGSREVIAPGPMRD